MGRWWAVDVAALDIHTQGRTLDEAEDMARDAIAAVLAVPSHTIAVDLVVPEVASLLHGVLEARRRAAEAADAERQALADAARVLFEDMGVTQSDACRLLGASPEQVAQFLPAGGSRPRHRNPLPAAGAPVPATGTSSDTGRSAPRYRRPRPGPGPGPADGASDNGSAVRPKRNRPPSFTRPTWAIADDDA
ncbi:hypothetical protein NGB36_13970 [Streptomyces sp. RB6PN25]|uniref:XRE family transcriptional regulator n=1 Tax=Streptomyces humicola TaxID=2953240 RepID=A0ABT1PVL4_9ACTN|nr:hypothetical protein [Streptomyces humicola]MCQ4081684.1 hypothetical protein [Streptomyces humicola]